MPTPGERRALIFLAALAALGVTARGMIAMRGSGKTSVAGDRAGLARQIIAVDSAIASGGVKRRGSRGGSASTGSRNGLASTGSRTGSAPTGRRRASSRATGDTVVAALRSYRGLPPTNPPSPARDNREAYWRAREHVDSMQAAINARSRGVSLAPGVVSPKKAPPASGRLLIDLDVATAPEIATVPFIGLSLATRIVADRDTHGAFGSLQELDRVSGVGPALAKKLQPYVTFSLPPRLGGAGESFSRARKRHRKPG